MATKKTVSAAVTAVTADTADAATLRTNALKTVSLALSSDSIATQHWKNAGQAYSTIYDSRESMAGDEELKKSFFNLVSEKFGFSDALATKVARGCDSPEALLVKKEKAAARATQGTYWSRLLNYSFPPVKSQKGAQHGGADEAGEGETEAPKGAAKSAFDGLVDKLSSVIKGLETLEDAPERANITQALKHLGIARAHLRGI